MNKRERILAVINGQKPDHIPSAFWLHFPKGCESGESAINMHLDFFARSGTDICKVMNENLLPRNPDISVAQDWSQIKPFNKKSTHLRNQIDLVKSIVDSVNGEAVVLATIHGAVASISHILGGGSLYDIDKLMQVQHLRENPTGMKAAFDAVTEELIYLTEESIKAGADGIYYAALGGEKYSYTDEEFIEYVKPCDIAIMNAAINSTCINVLHICKDSINLDRYLGYPGQIVNWGVYSENLSLVAGKKMFPDKVLLGGLDDRSGVLVDGEDYEIKEQVNKIINETGITSFILGADCTLPTEIDYERIMCAVKAAAEFKE